MLPRVSAARAPAAVYISMKTRNHLSAPRVWAGTAFALAILCVLLRLPIQSWTQQPALTGDEVVHKFLRTVGQDRWGSIKTLVRKGEVTGNISLAWAFYHAPKLAKEHATWESYYKAPNMRLSFVRTAQNTAADMQGCDGVTAWVFSPQTGLGEHRLKPGEATACDSGFGFVPGSARPDQVPLRVER